MADLTAESASIALKEAISEWWLAFIKRDFEQAAFKANDINFYARALQRETFRQYEEEGRRASTSAQSERNTGSAESPT